MANKKSSAKAAKVKKRTFAKSKAVKNPESAHPKQIDAEINSPLTKQYPKGFKGFVSKHIYVILAFFVPFVIMVTAFGLMNVSPFGSADKQILVTDLWHQYFPFLADFQHKLQNGESLFWTWSVGGGVNYFALMSYYLASPLNFLTVFIPSDWLREFLMFSVSIKIALGGMFTSIFLRSVYKKNDISIMLFGCCFSFCAFFMGYYWNTIWLDTVCITPLVVLGAVKLFTENNFRLYTVTLALSLLTNYYIGLFTCIFVLLLFIAYNIVHWKNLKTFAFDLGKTAVFSLLGIGMTAFFLLPAFFGLQNTHASGSTFPTTFAINIGGSNDLLGVLKSFKSIFANLMNFTCAATKAVDAIPNISCGAVCIFFGFLYLTSKKIKLREKIVSCSLLLFMMLSCIIRQLDYIWHGFHFTNMIPYRFSYLISFVLIVMAFKAFTTVDFASALNVIIASICSLAVLALAINDEGIAKHFTDHSDWAIPTLIGSAIFIGVLAIIVLLYSRRIVPKTVLVIVLATIVIGQSGVTAYFGVKVTTVTTTSDYPRGEDVTKQLIGYMDTIEEDTPELWRAEMTTTQTLNDGALNHYNGLSMFNSMANEDITRFFENFGMMGWKSGNRYTYAESSPVTNLFMNLKYLIARDGVYKNTYDLSEIYNISNEKLLVNNHYVPMGFMTDGRLVQWTENDNEDQFNPFDKQNEFFRLATGIDEDVYTRLEVETQGHYDSSKFTVSKTDYGNYSFSCIDSTITPHVKWNYTAPKDGIYCMCSDITGGDDVTIMQNDQAQSKTYGMSRSYIACIGYFNKGDKISVYAQLKQGQAGTAKVYVDLLNQDVFEEGYKRVSRDVMTTTKCSASSMEGTINVTEQGLFYTSIPYEEGWTATVDGKKTEITPVGGSLVAFPLSKGEHTISLTYYPKGFWAGFAVSMLCAAAFAFICFYIYVYRKRNLKLKLSKPKAAAASEPANAEPNSDKDE